MHSNTRSLRSGLHDSTFRQTLVVYFFKSLERQREILFFFLCRISLGFSSFFFSLSLFVLIHFLILTRLHPTNRELSPKYFTPWFLGSLTLSLSPTFTFILSFSSMDYFTLVFQSHNLFSLSCWLQSTLSFPHFLNTEFKFSINCVLNYPNPSQLEWYFLADERKM